MNPYQSPEQKDNRHPRRKWLPWQCVLLAIVVLLGIRLVREGIMGLPPLGMTGEEFEEYRGAD